MTLVFGPKSGSWCRGQAIGSCRYNRGRAIIVASGCPGRIAANLFAARLRAAARQLLCSTLPLDVAGHADRASVEQLRAQAQAPRRIATEYGGLSLMNAEKTHHLDYPYCNCFILDGRTRRSRTDWSGFGFHAEAQDTNCDAWTRLVELVEEVAADGQEDFDPVRRIGREEWGKIITLPPTIAKLKSVKHFKLYRSNLVRLPPEIGEMTNLTSFTPYTSWRLHWFPYEITRCRKLVDTTVSTRVLYGNYKIHAPFPQLRAGPIGVKERIETDQRPGMETGVTCSVCNGPLKALQVHQVWISLPVGTDVLPLLVNACSMECIERLPKPAEGYGEGPHIGGWKVGKPPFWNGSAGYGRARPTPG